MPLQRIAWARDRLVAAAGGRLVLFDGLAGAQLAVWPESQSQDDADWIPLLLAAGEHLVAVTAADKCLRVFAVQPDGLTLLSERNMPKRPCALALAQDNTTILCGDKFGDVYALPLLPDPDYVPPADDDAAAAPFKPAANPRTVHTKKNLYSLQQQLRSPVVRRDKAAPAFELKLLLGHVSMLTDLAAVSVDARSYVLSADRDEHIRVSRGLPQTHVIHAYCQGHASFVSRLCVPPWAPEVLVSGGGDAFLLVWDWRAGRLLQRVPLSTLPDGPEVAVSGIHALSFEGSPDLQQHARGAILVSTEGSVELLSFAVKADNTLCPLPTIRAPGNVLDVAAVDDRGTFVVSVDNVHQPGSTTLPADLSSPGVSLLQFAANLSADDVHWTARSTAALDAINRSLPVDKPDEKQLKQLGESLYYVGNLRKSE